MDALEALLKHFDNSKLQVITSWTDSSLASGVSDPNVHAVLKEMDVPLYINDNIHLKLFIFEDEIAFHTSANITAKGLGLGANRNVEIGCQLTLVRNDWLHINDLLDTSSRVTDEMYLKAQQYVDDNKNLCPPLPPLVLPASVGIHPYSRQSLPQCKSPEELWNFYSGIACDDAPSACIHDLWVYKVTKEHKSKAEFFHQLGNNFRTQPFVKALVAYLEERKSLSFGAVNSWITNSCSDRPTPSRWEVKPATNKLYNWLTCFYNEISWSKPNHSQVIFWNNLKTFS